MSNLYEKNFVAPSLWMHTTSTDVIWIVLLIVHLNIRFSSSSSSSSLLSFSSSDPPVDDGKFRRQQRW